MQITNFNIERDADEIRLLDENRAVVARLGPSQIEDAFELSRAPAMRLAIDTLIEMAAVRSAILAQQMREHPVMEDAAYRKLWGLFTRSDGLKEIQRDDDFRDFLTDEEAYQIVVRQAAAGDKEAKDALAQHVRDAPAIAALHNTGLKDALAVVLTLANQRSVEPTPFERSALTDVRNFLDSL